MESGLRSNRGLPETYPATRLPYLIARIGVASTWALDLGTDTVSGSLAADPLFRGTTPDPTSRARALLDELAAQLLADATMQIDIELSDASPGDTAVGTKVVRRRLNRLAETLVRAGIDPDRITTSIGDTEDAQLRFRLIATEG
jgi:hypothetical protein